MIEYSHITRYDNIEFEQYLKLPGYSHSFLKSNIQGVSKYFNETDKVRVGKIVDAILTDPLNADMSHEFYPQCKALAFELKKMFGDVMSMCDKQVNYTGSMELSGLHMQTKARLDFLLSKYAVIDLKITNEKNVDALIEYMGYHNQLWHYSKMANVSKAYLMFYVIPLKKVVVKSIDVSSNTNEFWENKILDFGTVK